MTLNLPTQGSVDRTEVLEWVTEVVTVPRPDGSTSAIEIPIVRGGYGPLPADPAVFHKPSLPGYLSEWLRTTGSVRLRLVRR